MSLHVEWMTAHEVSFEVLPQGTPIGEHQVDAPLAVAIGAIGDCSVVVIEGSAADLRRLASSITARLGPPWPPSP